MAERALNLARREPLLILLAVGYVLFRVIGFIHVEPRIFRDTSAYEISAGFPILSKAFLAGGRAPTVPLLYKVVTGDEARIWAQLAISIACWLALAVAVAGTIRDRRWRPVAFGAVLVFALAPEIVLWDATLLSESVSLSLTAALVAAWLWIVRSPSWWAYGTMVAVAAAWALARDPHGYVIAWLAVVLAVSIAISRDWGGTPRMRAAGTVALVAIAATSYASSTIAYARWALPLQDVLTWRISTEPDQLTYFEDHGMPVTPELLAEMKATREGGPPLEFPPTSDSEEQLRDATPFQRWLLTEGRSTYTNFLFTHPGVAAEAFDHLREILLDPDLIYYASRASPWDGGLPAAAVYPRRNAVMIAWLVLALGLAGFAGFRFGPRREWAVPAFLIAASLPFAIFVWNTGAIEQDRHGLIPSVFLRLGALLLVLFAVDRLLQARRDAAGGARGPS